MKRTASPTGLRTTSRDPGATRCSRRSGPAKLPRRSLARAGPGRILRRHLCRLRAGADPRHHALEPPRLLRLLLDHRQRARDPGGVSVRGAQRPGDAVADVARGDRARRGRARLAPAAARPAGRLRRGHLRHGVDLHAARACGGARTAAPAVRKRGLAGRGDVAPMRVYCSDQAHSSIDKAVILLGHGQESLRKIPSDADSACAGALAPRSPRTAPRVAPIASSRRSDHVDDSVDPVPEIADCAAVKRSGCTSMRPTRASPRWFPDTIGSSAGSRTPIRWSSIRTSGCSPHSISASSIAGTWT